MVSRPELLEYQAECEIGQDFLLSYQRAVLLTLRQRGVLDGVQFKDCVQILEQKNKEI